MDRVRLGAQAFVVASAFNANIGAWNTARVTTLFQVCAAFLARRRATAGVPDALGRSPMRHIDGARPVVRGGTADARARAHTCRHSLCAGPWVYTWPRGGEVR